MSCSRWERLIDWAARNKNEYKMLEFKEKLVECIVYTVQEKVARRRIRDIDELVEYGRNVARKYGIEELEFHLERLVRKIEEIRRRSAAG